MSERVECVVVGAGVIGLAVARALALAGREVVVIEAAEAIGTETSSRNSEVIHAGIYYEPSSLKARFCVAGKRALYCYCAEHGVAHRAVTKLIVATSPAQIGVLHSLQAQAAANGVDDLRLIDADEARAMEPALRCVAALHSPSTGIIDSHGFMLALQGDAEARGAAIAFNAPLIGGTARDHAIELRVGGDDPITLSCRLLVNAAGLRAQRVAASLRGVPAATIPPTHFAKGNYFALAGKPPVSRLIYPVPEPGGLGVHITLDLSGQCRFGPDVEWIERVDYDVDPRRAERFYAAIRRYWPDLPDGALQPAYAGIRPKLGPAGAPAADFTIHGPRDHGIAGLVCLYGIESPGITAALAIADHVVSVLTTAP